MNRETSWSDFEKTWQSMEELKGELQRTELKLQDASKPSAFSSKHPKEIFLRTQTSAADGDQYFKERLLRKRKIYSRLKGSHLFHKQAFDDLITLPNNNESSMNLSLHSKEENLQSSHHQPLSKKPPEIKSKYIESALSRALLKVSENSSSTSSDSLKRSQYSLKGQDIPPPTKWLESEPSSSEHSKVQFSKWEKEYLNKEVPDIELSDTRTNSVDIAQTYVKLPVNKTLVFPTPGSLPENNNFVGPVKKLQNEGGFKKLKEIIEMQRERNNRIIAEMEMDPFLDEGVSNSGKLPDNMEPKVDTADAATDTRSLPTSTNAKIQVELVRKVSVAPPPKVYKGFSPVKSLSTESPTKQTFPQWLPFPQPNVSSPEKKSPKVIRKTCVFTVKEKDLITPFSWREGEKLCREKLGPPPCLILNERKEKVSPTDLHTKASPTKDSDENLPDAQIETIDLTDSPPQSENELKNDNKENDSPSPDAHLIAVRNILEQIADCDDDDDDDDETDTKKQLPNEKQSKKPHYHTKASKKRKATKQPDAKSPAPKFRHYNREQIREYIEKQRLMRKKKLHEERQKKFQAEQTKKERLQHLYEYQKLAAKSVAKPKHPQPLKLLHENIKVVKKVEEPQVDVTSPTASPEKGVPTPKEVYSSEQDAAITITANVVQHISKQNPKQSNSMQKLLEKSSSIALEEQSVDKCTSKEEKSQDHTATDNQKAVVVEMKMCDNSEKMDSLPVAVVSEVTGQAVDDATHSLSQVIDAAPSKAKSSDTVSSSSANGSVQSDFNQKPLSIENRVSEPVGLGNAEETNPHEKEVCISSVTTNERGVLENVNSVVKVSRRHHSVKRLLPKVLQNVENKIGTASSQKVTIPLSPSESPTYASSSQISSDVNLPPEPKSPISAEQPHVKDSTKSGESNVSSTQDTTKKGKSGQEQLLELQELRKSLESQVLPTSSRTNDVPKGPLADMPVFNFGDHEALKVFSESLIKQLSNIGTTQELLQSLRGKAVVSSPVHDVSSNDQNQTPVLGDYTAKQTAASEDVMIEGPLDSLPVITSAKNLLEIPVSPKLNTIDWDFSHRLQHDPYNFISTWQRKPLAIYTPTDADDVLVQIGNGGTENQSVSPVLFESSLSKESYSSKFSVSEAATDMSESREQIEMQDKAETVPESPSSKVVLHAEDNSTAVSQTSGGEEMEDTAISSESLVFEGDMTPKLSPQDSSDASVASSSPRTISNPVSSNAQSSGNDLSNSLSSSAKTFTENKTLKPSSNGSEGTGTITSTKISVAVENTSGDVEDNELKFDSEVTGSPVELQSGSVPSTLSDKLSSNHSAKDVEDIDSEVPVDAPSSTHTEEVEGNVSNTKSTEVRQKRESSEYSSNQSVTVSSDEKSDSVKANDVLIGVPASSLVQPVTSAVLDAGSVTRVVAEAASAAATSAVIAALKYQKMFPSKKELFTIMERGTSPLKNESNLDFVKSRSSHSLSSSSRHSHSVAKSGKESHSSNGKGSASFQSEQSIDEIVPSARDNQSSDSPKASQSPSSVVENSVVSGSTKTSSRSSENVLHQHSSSTVPEEGLFIEDKKKLHLDVSSPSPASLSDNESLLSTSMSTTESSVSHISQQSGEFNVISAEDSFAQLTLDMVRRMTYEEELRARHQLSLLEFQEKALVEKARAEMKWLELLKRKLQEKKASDKLPVIRKRQHELLLRLRQERAQLRCMQETYRSVSQKRQALLAEKKKLLTEPSSLAFQILSKTEPSVASIDKSSEKVSPSTSVHSVLSVVTADHSVMEESRSPAEIPEVAISSSSSVESVVESQNTSLSKTSFSKHLKSSQSSPSRPAKADSVNSNLSHHTSHSLESVLKGIKRLEANKRYLTKKEQRLLQRRSHVESLLQWQKKLDHEEKEVKELEQRAVELMEKSKSKSKYYVSTTSLSSPKTEAEHVTGSSKKLSALASREVHSETDIVSSRSVKTWSESKESGLVPEENFEQPTGTKDDYVTSENILTSSSLGTSQHSGTTSDENKTASYKNSVVDEVAPVHIASSSTVDDEVDASKLSIINSSVKDQSSSSVDAYSDSFVSATGTHSSSNSPAQIKSASIHGPKKRINSSARSLFITTRHRRQDSSGSDDSFTISLSETASDQSDIEGRIYALTEELKRRKAEAEKLKREQKKHHWEQLKEREISLQKQLEAYDKYILEASMELEEQLEAVNSPDAAGHALVTVKPQIKQPRVAKSRHLQKQPHIQHDSELLNNKKQDKSSFNISDVKDVPLLPHERKPQSSSYLAKKLRAIETKEILEEVSTEPSSVVTSVTSQISEKAESPSSIIETKEVNSTPSVISQESLPTEKESRKSSVAVENSVTYSPDFVPSDEAAISTKSGDVKSNETSGTDFEDTNKDSFTEVKQNEESSLDEFIEGPLEVSDNSIVLSSKTLQKNDSHSTEGESFESLSVVEEEQVKSESEKCSGSNGCSTPSPKNVLDRTFVVNQESDIDNLSSGVTVEEHLFIEKVVDAESNTVHCLPTSVEVSHDENLQHEKLVDKIVNDILQTLCEDTKQSIYNLIKEYKTCDIIPKQLSEKKANLAPPKSKLQTSLTTIHEEVAMKVSESVTNSLLQDAVVTVLKVFKKLKLYKSGNEERSVPAEREEASLVDIPSPEDPNNFGFSDVIQSTVPSVECTVGSPDDTVINEVKPADTGSMQDTVSVEQDWFNSGLTSSQQKTQLLSLDQQLLVRQYPYYYRQIPNKPPPPYTPPSTPLTHTTQTAVSEEVVKVPEKVNAIQEVIDKLDVVVDEYVTLLVKGKKEGISFKDIKPPLEQAQMENLDLVAKSQIIFQTFLFELTRETALKLYVENEKDQIKPKPWLRNQRLTQKPVFSLDKDKVLPSIQAAVRKILKVNSDVNQAAQSMWSVMKLGRKKRDFVDTIIVGELKEEEPDWVYYDADEYVVKQQLTDSIFNVLIDDTVNTIRNIQSLALEPNR